MFCFEASSEGDYHCQVFPGVLPVVSLPWGALCPCPWYLWRCCHGVGLSGVSQGPPRQALCPPLTHSVQPCVYNVKDEMIAGTTQLFKNWEFITFKDYVEDKELSGRPGKERKALSHPWDASLFPGEHRRPCLGKWTEGKRWGWTPVAACTFGTQHQASVQVGSDSLQGRRNCLHKMNSGKLGHCFSSQFRFSWCRPMGCF